MSDRHEPPDRPSDPLSGPALDGPPEPAPGPAETSRWALPVLTTVGLAAAVTVLVAGPAETARALGLGLGSTVLLGLALAPFALWAARGRPGTARPLLVGLALVSISWCALTLPRVGPFADLDWNWQGKLVDLAWLVVLFAVLRRWAREDAGLRGRLEPGSGRPAAVVIVGWFVAAAGLVLLAVLTEGPGAVPGDMGGLGGSGVGLERLLFDATYPNLTEELLWRGALLAVLDRALGTPWTFLGARVGWGLVLTTLGFGLGHGLLLTDSGLVFDPAAILLTGAAGLVVGWVRARTGSVWPAYLAHCAPELGLLTGTALGAALG